MKKYNGAILDHEGFIIFEFTTNPLPSYDRAKEMAREILYAWRATHPNCDNHWTLEEQPAS